MHPTDSLSQDHRVIERVLNALEGLARRLVAGQAVPPQCFIDAAAFITGFADGAHHRKEEDLLFPALEEAGLPRYGGPIGVMLAEHEEGRAYTAALREAAGRLAAGDAAAAAAVAENALGYVALLRQHIMKEDNILFAMAKRVLGPEAEATLVDGFAEVERCEGNRDQWLVRVAALEREGGAQS